MIKEVSQEQIDLEVKYSYRPLAIESGITILPLSELGDREFELLSYILVQREIQESKYSNITSISLMQGVSERGRDCVFYNDGVVSGLIQCKKYKVRLSRPQTIKEIIKFLLFSTLDETILPDPDNFEYKLYVSNDFTEPTIALIHSYDSEIEKEISSGNIKKYIEDLVHEYESFFEYKGNAPVNKVEELLKKIKVSYSNATDLSSRIYGHDSILSMFFNVKTVVDLGSADNLIRNALDDYGLKYLTDNDLKLLQERIGNTKEENRINLGVVDFFGYSTDFFKFIKGDSFKDIMMSLMKMKASIDKYQMDFVNSKIHELILEKITKKLLYSGGIHTFSVGIAAPYLFKRLTMKLVANSLPKEMLPKYYSQFSMSKEELISEISETLYESSDRAMNRDYSQLVGSPELVNFKIRMFEQMHVGLNNIDDAKAVFEKDIIIIRPILDEIENLIGELLPEEKTIIIKDSSFLDKTEELEKVAKTIKAIE